MSNDNEPIKIGRIARHIERTLDISLIGEVSIFMDARQLDALAKKRPNDYLAFLEEIGNILREPDFVAFHPEDEEMMFLKSYAKEEYLTHVYMKIRRIGTPARWYYREMGLFGKTALPKNWKTGFKRPSHKKPAQ